MISTRYYGLIRLHYLLKMLGLLLIFWGIVWTLHLVFYGANLEPRNYAWV